ncbi:undecaprenyl-diphosphatase [Bacillus sp. XF8]|uniref:undecaprenyl-diphosphatase n=1 Tax=Bacillus sp. XF8 TaxID=2819289 RepID=UPI001AA07666|nr:undecaprenyl-diphosphatase [Bacillus sp. XF8]MBO1583251.1 undecaprenyl-diphosphatase [Bacillus sp. XF8]
MNSINNFLFRSINDLGFHLTVLNPVMVFMAEYGVFLLAIWMILHWFFTKKKVRVRTVLAGSLLAFLFSEVIGKMLGKFIAHPQPFATLPNVNQLISHEIDNSFPSDHTILFFSICMMLFLGSQSSKRVSYLIAATIVGFSRIWVGVHYPIDVLAAAFIGIFVSIILYPVITHSKILIRIINTYNRFTEKF